MPRFGRCETVSEIYQGAFSIVYRGRSESQPGRDLAVKVLSLPTAFMDAESAAARSDRFLQIAQAQQKAAAGAEYWAPVYESGTSPEGVFYVTDCFERSLVQVIDGQAKLSPEVFHRIIESVVLGLVELKKTSNRPHGNLKLSNVLISDTSAVPVSRVAITDPLPDSEVESQHWAGDLSFVGELIYQLIMHRPPNQLYTAKVAKTDNWKTLGRDANGWIQLCNTLLHPSDVPTPITLEDVATEVRLLRPKPNRTIPLTIAVVFVLLPLLIITGIYGYRRIDKHFNPDKYEAPTVEQWKTLIEDYLVWNDDFCKKAKDVQEDDWRDAGLEPVMEACNNLDYPRKVAEKNKQYIGEMTYEDWLLDSLRETANKAKTQDAQEAADTVRSFLTVGHEKAWLLLGQVKSVADQLGKHECSNAAGFLDKLIEAVEPPDAAEQEQMIGNEETVDIVADIESILQIRDSLTNIAQGLDDIKGIEKSITDIDTKLEPFAAAVDTKLAILLEPFDQKTAVTIMGIDRIIKEFRSKVKDLADELKNIDLLAFDKDYEGNLEEKSFEDFEKISEDYQRITYPHNNKKVSLLENIKTCRDKLATVMKNKALKTDGEECDRNLKKLEATVKSFEKDCQGRGLYFIAVNSINIEKAWKKHVSDVLETLAEKTQALVEKNTPPGEYFAGYQSFLDGFSVSKVLQDAGKNRFASIKNRFYEDAHGTDESTDILYDEEYKIHEDCERLRKDITAFDEKRKQLDAEIDAIITADKFAGTGIDAKEFDVDYATARENVFAKVIPTDTAIPMPREPDELDDIKGFDKNIDNMASLLDRIAVLNGYFREFFLLNEKIDGELTTIEAYAADFSNLSNSLQNSSLGIMFQDQEKHLGRVCDDLKGTIASLKRIEQSNDSAEIIRLGGLDETTPVAQGPNRVLVRSAWKKLQSMGCDPGERISAQTVSSLEKWYAGSGREKMLVDDLKTSVTNIYKGSLGKIAATLESELSLIEENGVDTSGAAYSEFKEFARTVRANVQDAQARLKQEGTAKSLDMALRNALKNLDVDHRAASQLAAIVTSEKWDNNLYHITRFAEDWRPSTEANKLYEKYRRPDESFWRDVKDKQDKITIMSELEGNKVEIDLVGFQKTFEQEKQETVMSDDLAKVMQGLMGALKTIEDKLIPVFCRNLQWSETEKRVVFTDSAFNKDFEIVKLPSVAESASDGVAESASYSDKKDKWVSQTNWDKLRDKDQGKTLQDSFFADFDKGKTKPCWPKYIRSKQDDSVILRYIPGDGNIVKPFYMSIRETTYEQFKKFLKVHLNPNVNDKWTIATKNVVYSRFLADIDSDFPPDTRPRHFWTGALPLNRFTIKYADPDTPIVWVRLGGAGDYCSWLGKKGETRVRLPEVNEHKQAAKYASGKPNPHYAAKTDIDIFWEKYLQANSEARLSHPYPWGIIFKAWARPEGKSGDPKDSIFPRDTSTELASEKGIHDLIGNVWELCTDPKDQSKFVVCGYSCLTPEEFRVDESGKGKFYELSGSGTLGEYKYEVEPSCDVGFRVVVDLPQPK